MLDQPGQLGLVPQPAVGDGIGKELELVVGYKVDVCKVETDVGAVVAVDEVKQLHALAI